MIKLILLLALIGTGFVAWDEAGQIERQGNENARLASENAGYAEALNASRQALKLARAQAQKLANRPLPTCPPPVIVQKQPPTIWDRLMGG